MTKKFLEQSLNKIFNSPGILEKFPDIERIDVKSLYDDDLYEFDIYVKLNKDFDSKFELSFEPRTIANYLIDILTAMNISKRDILQIYTSVTDKSGKIIY